LKEEAATGELIEGAGAEESTVTVAFCFVPAVAVVALRPSVRSWYCTVIVELA
jgi:hypothetical protein